MVQNVTMKRNNVIIKRDRSLTPHVGSTLTSRSSDIPWHRVTQAWYCPSVIIIRPPIKRVRAPVFRSFISVTPPRNRSIQWDVSSIKKKKSSRICMFGNIYKCFRGVLSSSDIQKVKRSIFNIIRKCVRWKVQNFLVRNDKNMIDIWVDALISNCLFIQSENHWST